MQGDITYVAEGILYVFSDRCFLITTLILTLTDPDNTNS